jgi:hypothetical protein
MEAQRTNQAQRTRTERAVPRERLSRAISAGYGAAAEQLLRARRQQASTFRRMRGKAIAGDRSFASLRSQRRFVRDREQYISSSNERFQRARHQAAALRFAGDKSAIARSAAQLAAFVTPLGPGNPAAGSYDVDLNTLMTRYDGLVRRIQAQVSAAREAQAERPVQPAAEALKTDLKDMLSNPEARASAQEMLIRIRKMATTKPDWMRAEPDERELITFLHSLPFENGRVDAEAFERALSRAPETIREIFSDKQVVPRLTQYARSAEERAAFDGGLTTQSGVGIRRSALGEAAGRVAAAAAGVYQSTNLLEGAAKASEAALGGMTTTAMAADIATQLALKNRGYAVTGHYVRAEDLFVAMRLLEKPPLYAMADLRNTMASESERSATATPQQTTYTDRVRSEQHMAELFSEALRASRDATRDTPDLKLEGWLDKLQSHLNAEFKEGDVARTIPAGDHLARKLWTSALQHKLDTDTRREERVSRDAIIARIRADFQEEQERKAREGSLFDTMMSDLEAGTATPSTISATLSEWLATATRNGVTRNSIASVRMIIPALTRSFCGYFVEPGSAEAVLLSSGMGAISTAIDGALQTLETSVNEIEAELEKDPSLSRDTALMIQNKFRENLSKNLIRNLLLPMMVSTISQFVVGTVGSALAEPPETAGAEAAASASAAPSGVLGSIGAAGAAAGGAALSGARWVARGAIGLTQSVASTVIPASWSEWAQTNAPDPVGFVHKSMQDAISSVMKNQVDSFLGGVLGDEKTAFFNELARVMGSEDSAVEVANSLKTLMEQSKGNHAPDLLSLVSEAPIPEAQQLSADKIAEVRGTENTIAAIEKLAESDDVIRFYYNRMKADLAATVRRMDARIESGAEGPEIPEDLVGYTADKPFPNGYQHGTTSVARSFILLSARAEKLLGMRLSDIHSWFPRSARTALDAIDVAKHLGGFSAEEKQQANTALTTLSNLLNGVVTRPDGTVVDLNELIPKFNTLSPTKRMELINLSQDKIGTWLTANGLDPLSDAVAPRLKAAVAIAADRARESLAQMPSTMQRIFGQSRTWAEGGVEWLLNNASGIAWHFGVPTVGKIMLSASMSIATQWALGRQSIKSAAQRNRELASRIRQQEALIEAFEESALSDTYLTDAQSVTMTPQDFKDALNGSAEQVERRKTLVAKLRVTLDQCSGPKQREQKIEEYADLLCAVPDLQSVDPVVAAEMTRYKRRLKSIMRDSFTTSWAKAMQYANQTRAVKEARRAKIAAGGDYRESRKAAINLRRAIERERANWYWSNNMMPTVNPMRSALREMSTRGINGVVAGLMDTAHQQAGAGLKALNMPSSRKPLSVNDIEESTFRDTMTAALSTLNEHGSISANSSERADMVQKLTAQFTLFKSMAATDPDRSSIGKTLSSFLYIAHFVKLTRKKFEADQASGYDMGGVRREAAPATPSEMAANAVEEVLSEKYPMTDDLRDRVRGFMRELSQSSWLSWKRRDTRALTATFVEELAAVLKGNGVEVTGQDTLHLLASVYTVADALVANRTTSLFGKDRREVAGILHRVARVREARYQQMILERGAELSGLRTSDRLRALLQDSAEAESGLEALLADSNENNVRFTTINALNIQQALYGVAKAGITVGMAVTRPLVAGRAAVEVANAALMRVSPDLARRVQGVFGSEDTSAAAEMTFMPRSKSILELIEGDADAMTPQQHAAVEDARARAQEARGEAPRGKLFESLRENLDKEQFTEAQVGPQGPRTINQVLYDTSLEGDTMVQGVREALNELIASGYDHLKVSPDDKDLSTLELLRVKQAYEIAIAKISGSGGDATTDETRGLLQPAITMITQRHELINAILQDRAAWMRRNGGAISATFTRNITDSWWASPVSNLRTVIRNLGETDFWSSNSTGVSGEDAQLEALSNAIGIVVSETKRHMGLNLSGDLNDVWVEACRASVAEMIAMATPTYSSIKSMAEKLRTQSIERLRVLYPGAGDDPISWWERFTTFAKFMDDTVQLKSAETLAAEREEWRAAAQESLVRDASIRGASVGGGASAPETFRTIERLTDDDARMAYQVGVFSSADIANHEVVQNGLTELAELHAGFSTESVARDLLLSGAAAELRAAEIPSRELAANLNIASGAKNVVRSQRMALSIFCEQLGLTDAGREVISSLSDAEVIRVLDELDFTSRSPSSVAVKGLRVLSRLATTAADKALEDGVGSDATRRLSGAMHLFSALRQRYPTVSPQLLSLEYISNVADAIDANEALPDALAAGFRAVLDRSWASAAYDIWESARALPWKTMGILPTGSELLGRDGKEAQAAPLLNLVSGPRDNPFHDELLAYGLALERGERVAVPHVVRIAAQTIAQRDTRVLTSSQKFELALESVNVFVQDGARKRYEINQSEGLARLHATKRTFDSLAAPVKHLVKDLRAKEAAMTEALNKSVQSGNMDHVRKAEGEFFVAATKARKDKASLQKEFDKFLRQAGSTAEGGGGVAEQVRTMRDSMRAVLESFGDIPDEWSPSSTETVVERLRAMTRALDSGNLKEFEELRRQPETWSSSVWSTIGSVLQGATADYVKRFEARIVAAQEGVVAGLRAGRRTAVSREFEALERVLDDVMVQSSSSVNGDQKTILTNFLEHLYEDNEVRKDHLEDVLERHREVFDRFKEFMQSEKKIVLEGAYMPGYTTAEEQWEEILLAAARADSASAVGSASAERKITAEDVAREFVSSKTQEHVSEEHLLMLASFVPASADGEVSDEDKASFERHLTRVINKVGGLARLLELALDNARKKMFEVTDEELQSSIEILQAKLSSSMTLEQLQRGINFGFSTDVSFISLSQARQMIKGMEGDTKAQMESYIQGLQHWNAMLSEGSFRESFGRLRETADASSALSRSREVVEEASAREAAYPRRLQQALNKDVRTQEAHEDYQPGAYSIASTKAAIRESQRDQLLLQRSLARRERLVATANAGLRTLDSDKDTMNVALRGTFGDVSANPILSQILGASTVAFEHITGSIRSEEEHSDDDAAIVAAAAAAEEAADSEERERITQVVDDFHTTTYSRKVEAIAKFTEELTDRSADIAELNSDMEDINEEVRAWLRTQDLQDPTVLSELRRRKADAEERFAESNALLTEVDRLKGILTELDPRGVIPASTRVTFTPDSIFDKLIRGAELAQRITKANRRILEINALETISDDLIAEVVRLKEQIGEDRASLIRAREATTSRAFGSSALLSIRLETDATARMTMVDRLIFQHLSRRREELTSQFSRLLGDTAGQLFETEASNPGNYVIDIDGDVSLSSYAKMVLTAFRGIPNKDAAMREPAFVHIPLKIREALWSMAQFDTSVFSGLSARAAVSYWRTYEAAKDRVTKASTLVRANQERRHSADIGEDAKEVLRLLNVAVLEKGFATSDQVPVLEDRMRTLKVELAALLPPDYRIVEQEVAPGASSEPKMFILTSAPDLTASVGADASAAALGKALHSVDAGDFAAILNSDENFDVLRDNAHQQNTIKMREEAADHRSTASILRSRIQAAARAEAERLESEQTTERDTRELDNRVWMSSRDSEYDMFMQLLSRKGLDSMKADLLVARLDQLSAGDTPVTKKVLVDGESQRLSLFREERGQLSELSDAIASADGIVPTAPSGAQALLSAEADARAALGAAGGTSGRLEGVSVQSVTEAVNALEGLLGVLRDRPGANTEAVVRKQQALIDAFKAGKDDMTVVAMFGEMLRSGGAEHLKKDLETALNSDALGDRGITAGLAEALRVVEDASLEPAEGDGITYSVGTSSLEEVLAQQEANTLEDLDLGDVTTSTGWTNAATKVSAVLNVMLGQSLKVQAELKRAARAPHSLPLQYREFFQSAFHRMFEPVANRLRDNIKSRVTRLYNAKTGVSRAVQDFTRRMTESLETVRMERVAELRSRAITKLIERDVEQLRTSVEELRYIPGIEQFVMETLRDIPRLEDRGSALREFFGRPAVVMALEARAGNMLRESAERRRSIRGTAESSRVGEAIRALPAQVDIENAIALGATFGNTAENTVRSHSVLDVSTRFKETMAWARDGVSAVLSGSVESAEAAAFREAATPTAFSTGAVPLPDSLQSVVRSDTTVSGSMMAAVAASATTIVGASPQWFASKARFTNTEHASRVGEQYRREATERAKTDSLIAFAAHDASSELAGLDGSKEVADLRKYCARLLHASRGAMLLSGTTDAESEIVKAGLRERTAVELLRKLDVRGLRESAASFLAVKDAAALTTLARKVIAASPESELRTAATVDLELGVFGKAFRELTQRVLDDLAEEDKGLAGQVVDGSIYEFEEDPERDTHEAILKLSRFAQSWTEPDTSFMREFGGLVAPSTTELNSVIAELEQDGIQAKDLTVDDITRMLTEEGDALADALKEKLRRLQSLLEAQLEVERSVVAEHTINRLRTGERTVATTRTVSRKAGENTKLLMDVAGMAGKFLSSSTSSARMPTMEATEAAGAGYDGRLTRSMVQGLVSSTKNFAAGQDELKAIREAFRVGLTREMLASGIGAGASHATVLQHIMGVLESGGYRVASGAAGQAAAAGAATSSVRMDHFIDRGVQNGERIFEINNIVPTSAGAVGAATNLVIRIPVTTAAWLSRVTTAMDLINLPSTARTLVLETSERAMSYARELGWTDAEIKSRLPSVIGTMLASTPDLTEGLELADSAMNAMIDGAMSAATQVLLQRRGAGSRQGRRQAREDLDQRAAELRAQRQEAMDAALSSTRERERPQAEAAAKSVLSEFFESHVMQKLHLDPTIEEMGVVDAIRSAARSVAEATEERYVASATEERYAAAIARLRVLVEQVSLGDVSAVEELRSTQNRRLIDHVVTATIAALPEEQWESLRFYSQGELLGILTGQPAAEDSAAEDSAEAPREVTEEEVLEAALSALDVSDAVSEQNIVQYLEKAMGTVAGHDGTKKRMEAVLDRLQERLDSRPADVNAEVMASLKQVLVQAVVLSKQDTARALAHLNRSIGRLQSSVSWLQTGRTETERRVLVALDQVRTRYKADIERSVGRTRQELESQMLRDIDRVLQTHGTSNGLTSEDLAGLVSKVRFDDISGFTWQNAIGAASFGLNVYSTLSPVLFLMVPGGFGVAATVAAASAGVYYAVPWMSSTEDTSGAAAAEGVASAVAMHGSKIANAVRADLSRGETATVEETASRVVKAEHKRQREFAKSILEEMHRGEGTDTGERETPVAPPGVAELDSAFDGLLAEAQSAHADGNTLRAGYLLSAARSVRAGRLVLDSEEAIATEAARHLQELREAADEPAVQEAYLRLGAFLLRHGAMIDLSPDPTTSDADIRSTIESSMDILTREELEAQHLQLLQTTLYLESKFGLDSRAVKMVRMAVNPVSSSKSLGRVVSRAVRQEYDRVKASLEAARSETTPRSPAAAAAPAAADTEAEVPSEATEPSVSQESVFRAMALQSLGVAGISDAVVREIALTTDALEDVLTRFGIAPETAAYVTLVYDRLKESSSEFTNEQTVVERDVEILAARAMGRVDSTFGGGAPVPSVETAGPRLSEDARQDASDRPRFSGTGASAGPEGPPQAQQLSGGTSSLVTRLKNALRDVRTGAPRFRHSFEAQDSLEPAAADLEAGQAQQAEKEAVYARMIEAQEQAKLDTAVFEGFGIPLNRWGAKEERFVSAATAQIQGVLRSVSHDAESSFLEEAQSLAARLLTVADRDLSIARKLVMAAQSEILKAESIAEGLAAARAVKLEPNVHTPAIDLTQASARLGRDIYELSTEDYTELIVVESLLRKFPLMELGTARRVASAYSSMYTQLRTSSESAWTRWSAERTWFKIFSDDLAKKSRADFEGLTERPLGRVTRMTGTWQDTRWGRSDAFLQIHAELLFEEHRRGGDVDIVAREL